MATDWKSRAESMESKFSPLHDPMMSKKVLSANAVEEECLD